MGRSVRVGQSLGRFAENHQLVEDGCLGQCVVFKRFHVLHPASEVPGETRCTSEVEQGRVVARHAA